MKRKLLLATLTLALGTSAAFAQTSAPAGAPPAMDHAPGVLDHAPDFKGPPPSTLEPRNPRDGFKGPGHRHLFDPEMHALHEHIEATWAKLEADKAKGSKADVAADKDALIGDFAKMRERRIEFLKAHRAEHEGQGHFPHPQQFGGPGNPPPQAASN